MGYVRPYLKKTEKGVGWKETHGMGEITAPSTVSTHTSVIALHCAV